MPHSSDDPPSAPAASVESETPGATVADARTLPIQTGPIQTGPIRPARHCLTAKPSNPAAGAGDAAVDLRRRQLRQKQR
jgi:hypothetical protein